LFAYIVGAFEPVGWTGGDGLVANAPGGAYAVGALLPVNRGGSAIVGGIAGCCGRAGAGDGRGGGGENAGGGGCGGAAAGPGFVDGPCFICSIISLAEYPMTVFASPCGACVGGCFAPQNTQ
jgi:hypothetical protein